MLTPTILNSHPVKTLRKEISKYNNLVKLSGYSRMKKADLVNLMMKHSDKFQHIKHAKTPTPKPRKIKQKPIPAPRKITSKAGKTSKEDKPKPKPILPLEASPAFKAKKEKERLKRSEEFRKKQSEKIRKELILQIQDDIKEITNLKTKAEKIKKLKQLSDLVTDSDYLGFFFDKYKDLLKSEQSKTWYKIVLETQTEEDFSDFVKPTYKERKNEWLIRSTKDMKERLGDSMYNFLMKRDMEKDLTKKEIDEIVKQGVTALSNSFEAHIAEDTYDIADSKSYMVAQGYDDINGFIQDLDPKYEGEVGLSDKGMELHKKVKPLIEKKFLNDYKKFNKKSPAKAKKTKTKN